MSTFSSLLRQHIQRVGITDAELARSIGVRRQTIFRWKEGIVARPRQREDVLRCADKLRLTPQERDQLLLAAGFAPESTIQIEEEAHVGEAVHVGEAAETEMPPTEAPPSGQRPNATVTLPDSSTPDSSAPDSSTPQSSSVDRSHPSRPALFGWGATAAVVVLGLLAVTMGWFRPDPVPNPAVTPPVATPVKTPALPSPTPLALHAAAGETLVLVAQFVDYAPEQAYNVAGRVREALEDEIGTARLRDTRVLIWPTEIADRAGAQAALAGSQAGMVVWGEYDSGRVRVNVTTPAEQRDWEQSIGSSEELSAIINVDVPREVRLLATLALGRLYRSHGEFDNARAAFARALEQAPSDPSLRATLQFYLASVTEQGPDADLTAAIALYDQVIDLEPQWINARYNRGSAYLSRYGVLAQVADLTTAIDDFSWVLERTSAHEQTLLNRGIAYYQRNETGDLERALADLDRAVELDPQAVLPRYNRILALIRGDRPAAWRTDLEILLAAAPDSMSAHYAHCWGAVLDNMVEEAEAACDRALDLGAPDSIYDAIAIIHAQRGNLTDAADLLGRYLTWVDQQPEALYAHYRGPQVTAWLAALDAGTNPFDAATLATLR